jgi:hypothetical protein
MAAISIPLGDEKTLRILYSYPNIPCSDESLSETIRHWTGQTLERDGLSKEMVTVELSNGEYSLQLDGPSEAQNAAYAKRIPEILNIGWTAWIEAVSKVKNAGKWDPNGTEKWRFFLTLGVGYIEFDSLQFFHYPPNRLLDPLRDSMNDPVTFRLRDLLVANSVPDNLTRRYETRINSTPIAAPDDAGSGETPNSDPIRGGTIPIEFFGDFQEAMVKCLLHPHETVPGYTIPMLSYGKNSTMQIGGLFLRNTVATLEILEGLRTPILSTSHPYLFLYLAQDAGGKGKVGSGKIVGDVKTISRVMRQDLSSVRWQVVMAHDPSQDPAAVHRASKAYWDDPAQALMVCALVCRHGSLVYPRDDPLGNHFSYQLTLEDALTQCKTRADIH